MTQSRSPSSESTVIDCTIDYPFDGTYTPSVVRSLIRATIPDLRLEYKYFFRSRKHLFPKADYWDSSVSMLESYLSLHSTVNKILDREGHRRNTEEPPRDKLFRVKGLIQTYLNIYPVTHSNNTRLLATTSAYRLPTPSFVRSTLMQNLASTEIMLDCRLNALLAAATAYKDLLKIPYPDCTAWDQTAYRKRVGLQKWQALGGLRNLVANSMLFKGHPEAEGHFVKGSAYLAAALDRAGYDEVTAEEPLDRMQGVAEGVSRSYDLCRQLRLAEREEVRRCLVELGCETGKELTLPSTVVSEWLERL